MKKTPRANQRPQGRRHGAKQGRGTGDEAEPRARRQRTKRVSLANRTRGSAPGTNGSANLLARQPRKQPRRPRAEKAAADKAAADKAAADKAAARERDAAVAAGASKPVLASTEDEDTRAGAAAAAAAAAAAEVDEATGEWPCLNRCAAPRPRPLRRAHPHRLAARATARHGKPRIACPRPPSPGAGAGASVEHDALRRHRRRCPDRHRDRRLVHAGRLEPPQDAQKQGTQVADATLKPANPPGTPGSGTGPGSAPPQHESRGGTSNPMAPVNALHRRAGTANPPSSTDSPVTPSSHPDPSTPPGRTRRRRRLRRHPATRTRSIPMPPRTQPRRARRRSMAWSMMCAG